MRRLCEDKDTFVRTVYASALVKIADAAVRMLELSQAVKGPPSGPESSVTGIVEVSRLSASVLDIVVTVVPA